MQQQAGGKKNSDFAVARVRAFAFLGFSRVVVHTAAHEWWKNAGCQC